MISESILILAYLSLVAYFGYLGYKRTRSSSDYLIAGRDLNPFVMALSYGATFISTVAIVGFGGVAAWLGSSLLWLTFLNISIGVFVAFIVLGSPTRRIGSRLNAQTFPELLARRFNSKFIQVFCAITILAIMPLYAAAVLIGGTKFVATFFNLDYVPTLFVFAALISAYVLVGGLKSVMYTDALQGSIMFVVMITLFTLMLDSLGGFAAAFTTVDIAWNATVVVPLSGMAVSDFAPGSANFMLKLAQTWGFNGWNKMPSFLSQGWLYLTTTLVMGIGIGALAQPQLALRFMTVKSKKELNRAVLINGVFIIAMTGIIFIIGTLSNAWFYMNKAQNALQVAGTIDRVIPYFIESAMPSWIGIIFLLALMSAAMSTLSSLFHTMGTALGRDIVEQLFPKKKINSVLITRLGMLATVSLAVLLAYLFNEQPAIIARSGAIFFALCAAIFLPTYLAALFWQRMTCAAAIASMFTGLVVSLLWLLFVHFNEAKNLGLAMALFGKDSLLSGRIIFVDSMILALPASALVAVLVSSFTPAPSKAHLAKCFGAE